MLIYKHIDKVAHFLGGYFICTVLPVIPECGLLVAIFAGIVKEIYDYKHRDIHTPDAWDAIATAAGGLLGYFVLMCR